MMALGHTRSTDKHDSSYLPTLDGWRAVAISLVLLIHGFGPELIAASTGGLGVTIFFSLSGFLICNRLLSENRLHSGISLRNFYLRRLFRILPAAWLYLACITGLAAGGFISSSLTNLFSCLGFARNYWCDFDAGWWYTGHFWSLAVEEHFYLFMPLFLIIARPQRAIWLLPVIAVFVILWRFIVIRWGLASYYSLNGEPWTLSDTRLDSLLWGCFAAVLIDRCGGLPAKRWWGRAVWLIAPLAVVAYLQKSSVNVRFTLPPILIIAVLVGTTFNPTSLLSRFLELPAVRWLGRVSYSLYLWQQLFLFSAFTGEQSQLGFLQVAPWSWMAILGATLISYYAIERPMIALGRSFIAFRTPRRLASAEGDLQVSGAVSKTSKFAV